MPTIVLGTEEIPVKTTDQNKQKKGTLSTEFHD